MRSLKGRLKTWLYGRAAGGVGAFPYFGAKVYFPPNSLVFRLACDQGIYEAANVRLLQSAAQPDSVYLDVGSNIGLMSVPLLRAQPRLKVISIEASPSTAPILARTAAESVYRSRWEVLPVAAGDRLGETTFHCAAADLGAFDGMRNTGRVPGMEPVRVAIRTLDDIWEERGRPRVSVVKIDIEGAEILALRGARELLAACRPTVVLEWSRENLPAFSVDPGVLLEFAEELDYAVHAMPTLVRVHGPEHLRALMHFDETFVLFPA